MADDAANPGRQRSNLSDIIDALLATDAALRDFDRAIATLRALRDTTVDTRLDGATTAAIAWARRSVASAKTNEPRATLESRVAIAFAQNNFEAAIDLAKQLEAVGAHDEAQELLATAGRLDPQSSWLFETQIRGLLDAADYDAAIRELETRPLSARWTVRDRDALLATAFDRRAEAAIAKNDVGQARADLTRAIELAPGYPWTRYRLAGLLSADGASERGRALMSEGVRLAP